MHRGGADLHAHTTASDGRLTPTELVAAAVEAELEVLAVTDHDSAAGVAEAVRAAAGGPLDLVPGIEISSRAGGRELHLLGLWIDPSADALGRMSRAQVRARRERAEAVVARARHLGLRLDMEVVEATAAGAPIGRPHLARAMVRCGVVADFDEAFARYIGVGRPCFVPKDVPSTLEAIATVHDAGGVAVLAHPGASRARESLLAELADAGLDGAEVRHPKHGRRREVSLMASCRRLGLLPSGGSDFHGPGRGNAALGQFRVDREWASALRERAVERRRRGAQESSA